MGDALALHLLEQAEGYLLVSQGGYLPVNRCSCALYLLTCYISTHDVPPFLQMELNF